MASVINTNSASLIAQRNLSSSQADLTTSVQRLSSGLRINSAKDDAAGLGISQKLQSQITGSNVAARNANDAISMVSTAEGGMQEVSSMLQRMRELSTQGNNDSLDSTQRGYISSEITALKDEINQVAIRTSFNGKTLLNGSIATATGAATTAVKNGVGVAGATNAAATSTITITGTSLAAGSTLTFSVDGGVTNQSYTNDTGAAQSGTQFAAAITAGIAAGTYTGLATIASNDSGANSVLTLTASAATTAGSLVSASISQTTAGTAGLQFQLGTTSANDTQQLGSLFKDVRISSSGNLTALSSAITSATTSNTSSDMGLLTAAVDTAIATIAGYRSDLGSMSNRLDYNIANLQNQAENLTASMSRIMDTDYAAETAALSKNQVMQQAATAMLAQANQMPNAVLSLLK